MRVVVKSAEKAEAWPRAIAGTCALLASALLALSPASSRAQTGPVQPRAVKACFAPDALKSRPQEKAVVKGDRTFDLPEPERALAPFWPIPMALRGAVRRVTLPRGKKLVALTFDLCEQTGEIAGYDGAIVDYLRANAVKATFFAGGKWMRSHAERARQLAADPLFEIGNHSEAHRNLRQLAGSALKQEILAPQRAYDSLRTELAGNECVRTDRLGEIPPRLGLFRFPFGACNEASLAAVNDAGLLAIQWDVSTGDPAPAQSAAAIVDAMVRGTKPGSIIIAHANGRGYHTSQAIPIAIPKLKALGFEFVTVSELLAAGTPEIVQACFDSHPGDTDKYDHLLLASPHAAPGY